MRYDREDDSDGQWMMMLVVDGSDGSSGDDDSGTNSDIVGMIVMLVGLWE